MLIYSHRYLSISYDLNFSDKRQKHTSILKKTLKKENKHIFCRVDSSKDPTDGSISLCNVPKLNRSPYVVLPFDLVSIFLLFLHVAIIIPVFSYFFARGYNNTSFLSFFARGYNYTSVKFPHLILPRLLATQLTILRVFVTQTIMLRVQVIRF